VDLRVGAGTVSRIFFSPTSGVGTHQTTRFRTRLRRAALVNRLLSLLLLFFAFRVAAWAFPGHNALLPQPQQVHYGSGRLPLRGLGIRLATDSSVEDRFARDQLSRCLSAATKESVPVSEGRDSGTMIVLKRTGEVDALPLPGERPGPTSREAYRLQVRPDRGEVEATSSAGLFYGVQTLCQLIEGPAAEAVLPEVEIHDWPALAYRGTMVDMSHGPLPTENEIKRQLDFLARWKANQYYLYSEASIELEGYPLLNPEGRLSQDEVRRIIEYGRERHIDVIPNVELYAHLHDLFRVEEYSRLSDLPHGVEFDPSNPAVMPLLTDWINQLADLFPSPFVNIGFDETFQIEMAVKQQGASATATRLFVKQLADVTRLFQQRGKHVMAWADIMVRYPDIVAELPTGLIAVAWYYTADANDREYKHWLGPLVAKAVPHFVQPAVTSWAQIAPDFDTSFENIDTFIAAGRKSNALGVINSVWTDDGQVLLRMSFPGMAYGAAAAWQSTPLDRQHFFSDYARICYPSEISADVAAALEKLSQSETELQKVLGEPTQFALWEDPFFPTYLKTTAQDQQHLRETRLLAEEAETHLVGALALAPSAPTLNSLLVGARLLDYAGQKFQTPAELIDLWGKIGKTRPDNDKWWNEWESQVVYQDHSHLVDLMDAITELCPLYRAEWLDEYSPYRLASAIGRWDAEYEYWRRRQQLLQQFSDSTHEGDVLPPLETLLHEH
jgi:hexosaminidase